MQAGVLVSGFQIMIALGQVAWRYFWMRADAGTIWTGVSECKKVL